MKATMINFNNKPTKIISQKEAILIMNKLGMNWHGVEYWSAYDVDFIENKLDLNFELLDDGSFKIHDLNYIWEE